MIAAAASLVGYFVQPQCDRCVASGQRFFCSARVFLASVVTNAAVTVAAAVYWHSFGPFMVCSRPLALTPA